jgi:diacylglycerol kinase (ATP)
VGSLAVRRFHIRSRHDWPRRNPKARVGANRRRIDRIFLGGSRRCRLEFHRRGVTKEVTHARGIAKGNSRGAGASILIAVSKHAAKIVFRARFLSVKTCIICNPGAGSVDNRDSIREKLERFPSATVHFTEEEGDAARLAQEAIANNCEIVIAAGGDGTLNEVINGVASQAERVQVGLVPLGTGNDFARMLDLPESIDDCIDILRAGETRPTDLVQVTSDRVRYFINVSAGGFSGTVSEKMTPEIKQSWGPLAYLRGAAEALLELRAYRTEITLDDSEVMALDLYNVVIANGRYVAGGTMIAPEASIDDGLLDIVLIPQNGAGDLALVAAQIMIGSHLTSEGVVRRASKVAVNSIPGMWFNVDGELVGNEPAVFEIMPRALQFLAGPRP